MLTRLLSFSKIYDCFSQFSSPRNACDFFFEHKPGIKILDIGCGPASQTHRFIDSNYLGIDLSAGYIKEANDKYQEYENINFLCTDVNTFFGSEKNLQEKFDLIILCGILHHLSDNEVESTLAPLRNLLNPDGGVRTLDGVYTDSQSKIARWILSKDRGKFVRTVADYESLIIRHLPSATYKIYGNLTRFPYTHIVFSYGQT